jgi:hypothetical protein
VLFTSHSRTLPGHFACSPLGVSSAAKSALSSDWITRDKGIIPGANVPPCSFAVLRVTVTECTPLKAYPPHYVAM